MAKDVVPTARLELARCYALAPQASVSTNSTTSALFVRKYYFGALLAGAGGAGAGIGGGPEFAPAPGTLIESGLLAGADALSAAVSKIVFGASAFLVPM